MNKKESQALYSNLPALLRRRCKNSFLSAYSSFWAVRMILASSWKPLNVRSKRGILGPSETFLFKPISSLSRSTPLFTPLKSGEVKRIVQGHTKVKVDSTPNPLTPKPLSAISWWQHLPEREKHFQLFIQTLSLGQDLEMKCQPRLTEGKTHDWVSAIHCTLVAIFAPGTIISVKKEAVLYKSTWNAAWHSRPSFVLPYQEFSPPYFCQVEPLSGAKGFHWTAPKLRVSQAWRIAGLCYRSCSLSHAQHSLHKVPSLHALSSLVPASIPSLMLCISESYLQVHMPPSSPDLPWAQADTDRSDPLNSQPPSHMIPMAQGLSSSPVLHSFIQQIHMEHILCEWDVPSNDDVKRPHIQGTRGKLGETNNSTRICN